MWITLVDILRAKGWDPLVIGDGQVKDVTESTCKYFGIDYSVDNPLQRIDMRINGLLFDKEGNLVEAWAEYD